MGKWKRGDVSLRSEKNWKFLLGEKFIAFFPIGVFPKGAAVQYRCKCGSEQIVYTTAKELRYFYGICPKCRGTKRRLPTLELDDGTVERN